MLTVRNHLLIPLSFDPDPTTPRHSQGAGKTSMLLHAMVDNEADGCAMLEAHEDPEVVRLRLGKALDFEYNEVRRRSFFVRCFSA